MIAKLANFLKKKIQAFFGIFNIKLVKIKKYDIPVIPFDLFECVLFKIMIEKGSSFRFIQVGANYSLMDKEFSSLIRKYRIAGCLVEHIPEIFKQLQSDYIDQPQIALSNINIKSINSNEFGLIQKEDFGLSNKNLQVDYKVNSLKKICEVLKYDDLHLLILKSDINSDEIIYQALDEKLYPVIINYVWTEMSLEQNYNLKMRLLDEGYRFIDVGLDTICVRQYA